MRAPQLVNVCFAGTGPSHCFGNVLVRTRAAKWGSRIVLMAVPAVAVAARAHGRQVLRVVGALTGRTLGLSWLITAARRRVPPGAVFEGLDNPGTHGAGRPLENRGCSADGEADVLPGLGDLGEEIVWSGAASVSSF